MDKRHHTVLDTPLTVAALTECAQFPDAIALAKLTALSVELERDAMTLALRLFSEDDNTFSPETMEVMSRWRPRCKGKLWASA